MLPYATVEDYEDRYGQVEDPLRLGTLLEDATALISGLAGVQCERPDCAMEARLRSVCCSVVHRSLSAGDLAGMSNYSQTGVGYSASVTVSNPAGDMYLTATEKRLLGIGRARVGQTDPLGGGRDAP